MRRTLVVTNDFPPKLGGIQSFVFELVSRMDPADVVVYASSFEGDSEYDAALPFEVVRAPAKTLLPTGRTILQVVDLINTKGIEAVWYGSSAPLGLMAPALKKHTPVKRQVATSHAHEVWWAALPGTRQALHRIGQSVDHITYIAEYTRRHIGRALSPAARERMVKLSPAVTPADYSLHTDPSPVLERYGLAGRPIILCTGRLVRRKGQDVLLRAMPQILDAQPEAMALIVGRGPYSDRLKALAWRLCLNDSVIFTGGVPLADLPAFYAAAQVFAGPSRSRLGGLEVEGFGIVFLEAQASGVPVVVGRSGGTPEALRHGETGLLVDGTEPSQVAAAIVQLLADPAKAKVMGLTGRVWVEGNCDWDQRAATLIDLLSA